MSWKKFTILLLHIGDLFNYITVILYVEKNIDSCDVTISRI